MFRSGQRHIRQKAIIGVMSLNAFRTVVDGLGSTNLFCASLWNERWIMSFPVEERIYLGIVTQRVWGFFVSSAICKSSIMELFVKRLIRPLIAFSDHLSSLEFGWICNRCCKRFLTVWGFVENENGKLNKLLIILI